MSRKKRGRERGRRGEKRAGKDGLVDEREKKRMGGEKLSMRETKVEEGQTKEEDKKKDTKKTKGVVDCVMMGRELVYMVEDKEKGKRRRSRWVVFSWDLSLPLLSSSLLSRRLPRERELERTKGVHTNRAQETDASGALGPEGCLMQGVQGRQQGAKRMMRGGQTSQATNKKEGNCNGSKHADLPIFPEAKGKPRTLSSSHRLAPICVLPTVWQELAAQV